MTNPTGYTALDLVGFTDKGAYAGNVAYVKNDLVHYGGNVWRCLVDDTTAVTPSEGVNWTLFIGEPTNLVERIIAPIEQNPAESAWAVGRQFIYNDLLYEVITAISVGDSLVTYESTPATANIKLASPVETQLLDIKAKEGDLANLSTTAKTNLVAAINEVDSHADTNATAISKGIRDAFEVVTPSFSALPVTFTVQGMTADHVLVQEGCAYLSNPSAQISEWTLTTGANTLTISGSISGSTTVKASFGIKRQITATT